MSHFVSIGSLSLISIPESSLVDGLNRFALSNQRTASSSFDASLFHPDDAPHLGSDQPLPQHQNVLPTLPLTDLSGIEGGGGGGRRGGDGDGSSTADCSIEGVPNTALKQPPFFSTPYAK